MSDIHDYIQYILNKQETLSSNPPIHIYISRINSRVVFKIKDGYMLAGFYPSTFLQPVNGTENSILNWVLKLSLFKSLQGFFCFFLMFVKENPRQIFHSFTPLFLLYKPDLLTKQIGLTNWFVIPQRNLCSCIQKIKNKNSVADVFFSFTYACVTHSIVRDWLCYLVTKTKTLGTKKRNS